MKKKQITVIGASSPSALESQIAYETGKLVAKHNCILVNGGLSGIMEESARGAKDAGGIVVGILPSMNFSDANSFADVVIPSGLGHIRNIINILSGDIIIAIGGGAGTLSEITFAWIYGKTIIACSYAGGWAEKLAGTKIDDRRNDTIISFSSINELNNILQGF